MIQLLLIVPLIIVGLFIGTAIYRYCNETIVSLYVYVIVMVYVFLVTMFWYSIIKLIQVSCIYIVLLLLLFFVVLRKGLNRCVT